MLWVLIRIASSEAILMSTNNIGFYDFCFVWVEALRPNQQFFGHVGTEPPLPGYYQCFLGGKCILLKDSTRRPEWGSNPRPLALESNAVPLGHCASLGFYEEISKCIS